MSQFYKCHDVPNGLMYITINSLDTFDYWKLNKECSFALFRGLSIYLTKCGVGI
jgi:hypothetical protein